MGQKQNSMNAGFGEGRINQKNDQDKSWNAMLKSDEPI